MKHRSLLLPALVALSVFAGSPARADNMVSLAISPATGVVTLTPRWAAGTSLAGFHHMAQDLSLGGGANQFYSLKSTTIPAGGDVAAFTRYIAASGAATNHADIGSKLTPSSYSALTSADPDIGYGSVNFYAIHHKASGDYFTVLKPSSATASSVTDLKPMSSPGGPATLGATGYVALTFAAANVGHGLNMFYYLRANPDTGTTFFGRLDPGLLNSSADLFDLAAGGFAAVHFTGNDVGFGTDKFYYLRLDPVTGFTILGTLNGTSGKISDIANLGSVYSTLTFASGDVGFGSGNFYIAGATNAAEQSVSFAAIADKAVGQQFTVTPSASSGLPIALTVVAGSTGSVAISGPTAGVFTVNPTAAGVVILQATQAGNGSSLESNLLRQRFSIGTAAGTTAPVVTLPPASRSITAGGSATFVVSVTGTPAPTLQWTFNGASIAGATSATLVVTNVQPTSSGLYRAVATNSAGSAESAAAVLGISTSDKISGTVTEVGSNIVHPNTNIYDQMLLTGAAATVNADAGQVVRVSFVDLSNDIVQLEFSGAGTLAVTLDGASAPATAQNYNQPGVAYMKGNARIVITGANESTNIAIFSVGRLTAIDQSLFRSEVTYDGVADIASLVILSANGKFGSVRSGNASYFATAGYTGLFAPGVQFAGAVYVGEISASDTATAVLVIGSSPDTRITGGDLLQANGRAVQVNGVSQLRFVSGTTSNSGAMAAQANRARFEQNGTDVTAQIVVNP
jgi:hypothetical protein